MKKLFIVLTIFLLLSSCNNGNKAMQNQQRTDLQNELVQVNADIAVDQDKLTKAKEFKIGRSESKRDDDIKAADVQLQNDENRRDNIQKQLQILN